MKKLLIHSHEKSLHKADSLVNTTEKYTDNPNHKLDILLDVAGNVLIAQKYLVEFERMVHLTTGAKKIKKQYIKVMNYISAELHEDYREYFINRVQTIYSGYMKSSENEDLGGAHIIHKYIPNQEPILI